jgi:hypothetical protein
MVPLLRYLDSIDAPFGFSVFHSPTYLTTRVLPPGARRLAADRLREYVRTECRPNAVDELLAWAASLELLGQEWEPDLFQQFVLFTNDLDVQRGQSVRESLPELWEQITLAGGRWTNETRYATPTNHAAPTSTACCP